MAEQQFGPGILLAGAVDLKALKHQVKAKPGQTGGAPVAGGYVIDITENTFQAMVQTSATFPILLLLQTPTDDCLSPVACMLGDAVNAPNGQIQLSRINISSNPPIAQASQVQGTPALLVLITGHPMPLLQGLPGDDELKQLTDEVTLKTIEAAAQSGVSGTAPYSDDPDSSAAKSAGATDVVAGTEQVPPGHIEAHHLAEEGGYTDATAEYERVPGPDPPDALAAREHAKALSPARSGAADVHDVRTTAAAAPDDTEAQLAVADIDMTDGQIQDVFSRLLDFLAAGHRVDTEQVRKRPLEYFVIPEPTGPYLTYTRCHLATLMY